MSDIQKKVRAFIEENFMLGESTVLKSDDSLLELQIVDSTGFLELVQFLEVAFGIAVADDEMAPENLETIDNIVQFVQRKATAAGEGA